MNDKNPYRFYDYTKGLITVLRRLHTIERKSELVKERRCAEFIIQVFLATYKSTLTFKAR